MKVQFDPTDVVTLTALGLSVDASGKVFNPLLGATSTALSSTTVTETNVQDGVTRVKVTTFTPSRDNPTTIAEGAWTVTP